ncbi:STAS domain-containing protein [Poseidonocella sedimentorum]|uniref:Chemotaxis protein CheX n=1 Tax=Poseidonocella sedimentorum TaxID=871652 RepID=A0A1I6EHG9_9RHOB|nr:STAS domain-containing protein [Poseidonocella sedimentorum]SFR17184.1 chemotaxis protein CheX [Poseidonocella sedimentorum]
MSQSITLPEKLNSDAAASLLDAFREKRGADLEIAASDTVFVGGLCFQVLVAAKNQWQADGHTLSVDTHSNAFADGMSRLGMPLDVFSGGN